MSLKSLQKAACEVYTVTKVKYFDAAEGLNTEADVVI